jgi:hypothetical protein
MPESEACGVAGCTNKAVRSVAEGKLKEALPGVSFHADFRRVRLCRGHYRQFRKQTKKDRELDRLGW